MKSKNKKTQSLPRKLLSVCVKVIVVLLIVLVLAVAAFAVFFWDAFIVIVKNPSLIPYAVNNFETLTRGFKVSVGELESEQYANAEAQAKALEKADIKLSADDIAGLEDGALTEEERAQIIYNAMTSNNNVEKNQDSSSLTDDVGSVVQDPEKLKQETVEKDKIIENKPVSEETIKPEKTDKPEISQNDVKNEKKEQMTDDEYNMKVSELVAKVYSVKADFVSKLSAFETKIISEYKALPDEQRNAATKARIVSENMSYIMGLEAQCDAQVKAITDELTALMTAKGKTTTLVDQINAAYANEKEIKKAYYVSMYK